MTTHNRVNETGRELANQSAVLLEETTNSSPLLGALRSFWISKDEKKAKQELLGVVTGIAKGLEGEVLDSAAELAKLHINTAKDTRLAEMRIQSGHNMSLLSTTATSNLNHAVVGLYVDKNQQAKALAMIKGDPELKQLAAECLAESTQRIAEQLIRRNHRPKPR